MAKLPTSARPGACVLYGVRLSWKDAEILKLIPVISEEYDGQYNDPEEFISDASMGIKLKGGPYFLWQPNNETNSQNYIVLSYSIVLANGVQEYKRIKRPSTDAVIEFKFWLDKIDIDAKLAREYLVILN